MSKNAGRVLIDLSCMSDCQCDDALEHMFKGLTEAPAKAPNLLWDPVPNPVLGAMVEEFTKRYQAILDEIQNHFARFLIGEPIGALQKADVPSWGRWTSDEMQAVRARLERRAAADFTLEDWMQLVEYLLQFYFPEDVVLSLSDWLSVRAALAGKVQAAMEASRPENGLALAAKLVDYLPTEFGKIPPKILSPREMDIIRVARARAAENISALTDVSRHKMKGIIIQHVQAQMLGMKQGTHSALRQALFDEFGQLNRDFRRIAVTEAGEACNQGVIASLEPGRKVRRMEAYKGACQFCRSINGQVFTVVSPAAPEKDGQTEVWVGKTNIGRSAAPRRRGEEGLVARSENEMWWPAAGLQHPNCRGSWVIMAKEDPRVTPEFTSYMDELLKKHGLS